MKQCMGIHGRQACYNAQWNVICWCSVREKRPADRWIRIINQAGLAGVVYVARLLINGLYRQGPTGNVIIMQSFKSREGRNEIWRELTIFNGGVVYIMHCIYTRLVRTSEFHYHCRAVLLILNGFTCRPSITRHRCISLSSSYRERRPTFIRKRHTVLFIIMILRAIECFLNFGIISDKRDWIIWFVKSESDKSISIASRLAVQLDVILIFSFSSSLTLQKQRVVSTRLRRVNPVVTLHMLHELTIANSCPNVQ